MQYPVPVLVDVEHLDAIDGALVGGLSAAFCP